MMILMQTDAQTDALQNINYNYDPYRSFAGHKQQLTSQIAHL